MHALSYIKMKQLLSDLRFFVMIIAFTSTVSARNHAFEFEYKNPSKIIIVVPPPNEGHSNQLLRDGSILTAEQYYKKEREKKWNEEMALEQHKRQMAEISEFMKTHLSSTKYFHTEMKRILETNKVKDNLRRILEALELPENKGLREQVVECFIKERKRKKTVYSVFKQNTNNLVVNFLKDPYNDGYVN